MMNLTGLHHVTAMAGDPQANVDFYVGVLGLRLVKKTVNFDDPGTYHLYYGDHFGTPGTILTFFPWPHARRGRVGVGQATRITFQVAQGSLEYWQTRLDAKGLPLTQPEQRFGRPYSPFRIRMELRWKLWRPNIHAPFGPGWARTFLPNTPCAALME